MARKKDLFLQHIKDFNNPHNLRNTQIGLSGVKNLPLISVGGAYSGKLRGTYLTPYRLKFFFRGVLARQGFLNDDGEPTRAL